MHICSILYMKYAQYGTSVGPGGAEAELSHDTPSICHGATRAKVFRRGRRHHEDGGSTDFARSCRPAAVGEIERASRGASFKVHNQLHFSFYLPLSPPLLFHPSSLFFHSLFILDLSSPISSTLEYLISLFSQIPGEVVLPVDLQTETRGAHPERLRLAWAALRLDL